MFIFSVNDLVILMSMDCYMCSLHRSTRLCQIHLLHLIVIYQNLQNKQKIVKIKKSIFSIRDSHKRPLRPFEQRHLGVDLT